jgi:hypothetical protein
MGDYDTLAREIIEAGGLKALIRMAIEEVRQEDAEPEPVAVEPEPEPEPVAVGLRDMSGFLDTFETKHDFENVEDMNFQSGRVTAHVCLDVQGSYVDVQVDVDPDELDLEPDYVTVHLRVSDALDILQGMTMSYAPSMTVQEASEAERRTFVAAVAAALSTRLGL